MGSRRKVAIAVVMVSMVSTLAGCSRRKQTNEGAMNSTGPIRNKQQCIFIAFPRTNVVIHQHHNHAINTATVCDNVTGIDDQAAGNS